MNKTEKRVRLPARLCAGLFALLVLAVCASEQDAVEKAMGKISSYKDKGFVNVRGERRGYLAAGGSLDQKIKLFANQEYLAVIAGDADMEKVSMEITDHKGKKVASGESGEPMSVVMFTPAELGKYTFVIKIPGKGGYYQFSLVTK